MELRLSYWVHISDRSALSYLMRDGFTSVITKFQIGGHWLLRRHRYQLRKGKTPTAKEFEREMSRPSQLRLHAAGWDQVSLPIQVSDNVAFSLPEWIQRTATLKEKMIALGSSVEDAAKVAKKMNQDVPAIVQKTRDWIEARRAKPK